MPHDIREYGAWLEQFAGDLRPGLVALDLGCGVGNDARFLTRRGLAVVGVELSSARIRQAARQAPGASFVRANLAAPLPLRDRAFDLVTASLSLHYFDQTTTVAIVAEIARVLRPGGVLLLRVNVVGDSLSLYGAGVEREPDFFEVEPGRFKRFFTTESLRALLQPHFELDAPFRQDTAGRDQQPKQTIVARARRNG